jgi:hypothetical protein
VDVNGRIGNGGGEVDPQRAKVDLGFLLDEAVFFGRGDSDIDDIAATFEIESERSGERVVEG